LAVSPPSAGGLLRFRCALGNAKPSNKPSARELFAKQPIPVYITAVDFPKALDFAEGMNLRHIAFKKMNGLGNDFVIVDARAEPLRLAAAEAVLIADRKEGVGCDQIITLEPSNSADVFMRILNADGSEAGACGNAARCVAALLYPSLGRDAVFIETTSGILSANLHDCGLISVDMGVPRFGWNEIPLAFPIEDTSALPLAYRLPDGRVLENPSAVNVGNPHCIFWVSDAGSYDLPIFGPELERHSLFPERANISLAEAVTGKSSHARIKLRVWERGAGLTRACGTAACAAAVAAARTGRTGRSVDVSLPGGTLEIEWRPEDDHILMTGPAEFEFDGMLHLGDRGVIAETFATG